MRKARKSEPKTKYKMVFINYHAAADRLNSALWLILEIESATGMTPTTLELNEGATLVKFDRKDARKCVSGFMTEEEYIKNNVLSKNQEDT